MADRGKAEFSVMNMANPGQNIDQTQEEKLGVDLLAKKNFRKGASDEFASLDNNMEVKEIPEGLITKGPFQVAADRIGRGLIGAGAGAVPGAVIGAATDDEDRLSGAARGAGIGALGGIAGGLISKVGMGERAAKYLQGANKGQTLRDVAKSEAKRIPVAGAIGGTAAEIGVDKGIKDIGRKILGNKLIPHEELFSIEPKKAAREFVNEAKQHEEAGRVAKRTIESIYPKPEGKGIETVPSVLNTRPTSTLDSKRREDPSNVPQGFEPISSKSAFMDAIRADDPVSQPESAPAEPPSTPAPSAPAMGGAGHVSYPRGSADLASRAEEMKGAGRGKPAIADSPQPFTIQVKKKGIASSIGKMGRQVIDQRKILENAKNIGQRHLENAQASLNRSRAMNSSLDEGMDALNKKMRGLKGFNNVDDSIETKGVVSEALERLRPLANLGDDVVAAGVRKVKQNVDNPTPQDQKGVKTKGAHPGFEGASEEVAHKEGVPMKNAEKIIGAAKAKASAAAREKNPRLNNTRGHVEKGLVSEALSRLRGTAKSPFKGSLMEARQKAGRHLKKNIVSDEERAAELHQKKLDDVLSTTAEFNAQHGIKGLDEGIEIKSVGSHLAAAGAGALAGMAMGARTRGTPEERIYSAREEIRKRDKIPALIVDSSRGRVLGIQTPDDKFKPMRKIQVAKPAQGKK